MLIVTSLSSRHKQSCEGSGPGRSSHAAHVGNRGGWADQKTHVSPALRGFGRQRDTRTPCVISDTQLQSQPPLTSRHFSTCPEFLP